MKIRQQDAQRITFQPCILETGELGAVQTVVLRDVKIGRGWISGRNDNGVQYIDTDCVISREQLAAANERQGEDDG